MREPLQRQKLIDAGVRASRCMGAPRPLLSVTLIIALLTPITAHAAKNLYRFLNAEGAIEISHTIPSDRVALGYEVLDSRSGRVVQVVEAQKSPEEVARIDRETRARSACRNALARVNSLYQSEIDITLAEEQTLKSLLGRIENATENLRLVRNQKRNFEATAARRERAGESLQKGLLSNIERANIQLGNLEREIEQRHRQQDDAQARFARDLVLFRQATCPSRAELSFLQSDEANVSGGDG